MSPIMVASLPKPVFTPSLKTMNRTNQANLLKHLIDIDIIRTMDKKNQRGLIKRRLVNDLFAPVPTITVSDEPSLIMDTGANTHILKDSNYASANISSQSQENGDVISLEL